MTGHIVERQERELAAGHWLSSAAPDPAVAREEWQEKGITLLRCGPLLTAVRIPSHVVYAAADSDDRECTAGFLAAALGGPVFFHPRSRHFYALTPGSTAPRWHEPGAECLAAGTYLGVPAPEHTEPGPDHEAYWVVPMDGPGTLTAPTAIARLVALGQAAIARTDRESGGHA